MGDKLFVDINKKAVNEIIEKNISIAEESLSEFIVRCINDTDQETISRSELSCVLASVLSNALGGWRNVLGTVVNDERMYKWDTFDDYQHLFNDKNNNYYMLYDVFSRCVAYYSRWGSSDNKIASDIASIAPEIDFSHYIAGYPRYDFKKLPAWIMMDNGPTSEKTVALIPKIPDDYYVGVYVSRDDYPDAVPGSLNELHELFFPKDRWGGMAQEINLIIQDKGEVRHPGTIYLPAKEYAIKNNVYGIATMLPKHILESHGLPTKEI